MRAWARRGLEAARVGGDRADLWPAGALAWLAYLGWPVLLLVLAPPSTGDIAFFAVRLVTSGSFPLNVLLLGAGGVAGLALLCGLAALGEVGLLRLARDGQGPPLAGAVLGGMGVMTVAAVPTAGAIGLLLLGLIAAAPSEFPAADAMPLLLRLVTALWPLELLVVVALLVGQAFGGLALHAGPGPGERHTGRILVSSARHLVRSPWSPLGTALVGLLADALVAIGSYALLRVLWAPISVDLARGRLAAAETLLLLVGFVAIWLALLLGAGAVHVAMSAWWSAEPRQEG